MKERLDRKLSRRQFLREVAAWGVKATGAAAFFELVGCGPSQTSGTSKKEASPTQTPLEPEVSPQEFNPVVSEPSPIASLAVEKEVVVIEVPATEVSPISKIEEEPTPIPQEQLVERVLGGTEGRLLTVFPAGKPEQEQKVLSYSAGGGKFFALSVYPDKIVNRQTGEVFEVQFDTSYDFFSYPGSRLVLLNLNSSLKEDPEALPFVNINPSEDHPFGSLDFLDSRGELVARLPLFEKLQEGEVNIRFDEEKGAYEFLDKEGNVLREKKVFEVLKVTPTPVLKEEVEAKETVVKRPPETEPPPEEPTPVAKESAEPTPTPVAKETPAPEKESAPTAEAEVVCTALNVREKPWGKIVGYLEKGDKVKVTGYAEVGKEIWYQIEIEDAQGEPREAWISGYEKYVSPNVVKKVPEVEEESISVEPETEPTKTVVIKLDGFPLDAQDLSLSCESSAAKMVAAFVAPTPPEGYQDWEWYFIDTIPKHCNPFRGFRGKIDGRLSTSCDAQNDWGYGVYAEPVAEALQRAGIEAQVEYGVDYERVANLIKEGRPVMVWMSGKSVAPTYEIDPETSQKFPLLLGEHVWVVIGVSGEGAGRSFLINDPWKGRQFWVKGFPRWDVFNGMRVVVSKKTS